MNGKEKLLITGGLGNLGSWLTHYFSEMFDVYVLSKNIKQKLDCEYTVIECDITHMDALRNKLNISFSYCIHTASYNEFFHDDYAEKALNINTLGTRNLIEVLKDKELKNFIYLSTFHVYGASEGCITETSELSPKNDYASTHLFSEYYLKQFSMTHNFPSVIFRLTNSYGSPKYQESNKWYLVLNDLVRSAYEENKIILKGNGKSIRDFIWMGDVCDVIDKSFNIQSNSIFNLSSNRTYSMFDLAKKVQQVYVQRYEKDIQIELNEKDKTKPLFLEVDNSKLHKEISITFNDNFDEEINNIFDLLEKV